LEVEKQALAQAIATSKKEVTTQANVFVYVCIF
jgi:hypothetical protein